MTQRRYLALLVVFMLITGVIFAGCSKSAEPEAPSATNDSPDSAAGSGNDNEPYKPKVDSLTIMVNYAAAPDTNQTLDWMQEQLGIKLKFIAIPDSKEYNTKLNLLISTGDIPDIVMDTSIDSRNKNIEQGLYIPLDELISKYGPNIQKARTPEQLESLKWTDGKIYNLANYYTPGNDMLLIRNDWLKKVNLPIPTTLDELTTVLKAFRDDDPTGTGKKITPIGSFNGGLYGLNSIFGAYGANPFGWSLKDGKIVQGALQPEVKEAIKYIHMLYAENLLDKEYISIPYQKVTEKAAAEELGIWDDQLWYTDKNYAAYHKNPNTDLVAIAPFKGPTGKSGYIGFNSPLGVDFTGITKASKDPVMAMKVLNFLADIDNYYRIRTGVEGTHYTIENGVFTPAKKYSENGQLLTQEGIAPTYSFAFMPEDPPKFSVPVLSMQYLELKTKTTIYAPFLETPPAISDKQIGAGWDKVRDEQLNKMIVQGGDIDAKFDAMVKTIYDKYDMANMEKLANEYYEKYYKK